MSQFRSRPAVVHPGSSGTSPGSARLPLKGSARRLDEPGNLFQTLCERLLGGRRGRNALLPQGAKSGIVPGVAGPKGCEDFLHRDVQITTNVSQVFDVWTALSVERGQHGVMDPVKLHVRLPSRGGHRADNCVECQHVQREEIPPRSQAVDPGHFRSFHWLDLALPLGRPRRG